MAVLSTTVDFENFSESATVSNGATTLGTGWSVNATATLTALAAAATTGSRGGRLASTGTGFWQGIYTFTNTTAQRVLAFDFIVRSFTAVSYVGTILDGASTNKGQWRINTNGTVAIRNNTSAVSTSGSSLSSGTVYHAEWMTNTGAATQELRIWSGGAASGTPYITLTGSISAATSQNGFYFGFGAAANGSGVDFDNVRIADDWIGPPAGTGTGTFTWAGAAVGETPSGGSDGEGSATGSFAWSGAAVGDTPLITDGVLILGDSLTNMLGSGATYLATEFAADGWDTSRVYVSGVTGRNIWGGATTPTSETTIDDWRASKIDAETWIVALGANNQSASQATLQGYYDDLLTHIGPGRTVHFIDQGFEGQSENLWSYNGAAALGSRYTKNGGSGVSEVNAAIRNIADLANASPGSYPTCVVHNWNGYAAMRAAGGSIWNPGETSSIGGTARHMTATGYEDYRAPFYAAAVEDESPDAAPNEGSATGTFTWTGTAVGKRTPKGSATGTFTWTGAAVGKRTPKGSATGTFAWSGAAVGKRTPKGSATGTANWAGTATGARASLGSATGTFTWAGTAAGKRPAGGTATGTFTWAGAAAGKRPAGGTGTGTYAYTGTAAGKRTPKASATGTYAWAGEAIGNTPSVDGAEGSALGSYQWTGTATGARTPLGTATGAYAWAGAAVGHTPTLDGAEGTAAGAYAYIGSATGHAPGTTPTVDPRRIYAIPQELRVATVPAERRVLSVPALHRPPEASP